MNLCFDSEQIAARLVTDNSDVKQSPDPVNSGTSGNSLHFYGIPLRKSGDITTHLSCDEISELKREFEQLKLAAVTSRDIKKNWPYQHIYVSTVDKHAPGKMANTTAQNSNDIPPDSQIEQFIPSEITFTGDINKMIEWDTYQLELQAVVHLDGKIKEARLSPSERHAMIWGENEVHCWSRYNLGNWQEEGALRGRTVEKATFSPSGRYALAAAEGLCKIWCFGEGANWFEQIPIHYRSSLANICFSPTERALVITSRSDNHHTDTFALYVCNDNGRWVSKCLSDGNQGVSFKFSPCGNNILVTSKGGAELLNICVDGRVISQYSFNSQSKNVRAAFSEAGHHAVIFTKSVYPHEENQLRIIGRVGDKWQEMGSFNYVGLIWDAELSESARHLMIHTHDEKIRIWSVNDEGRYVEKKVVPDKPSGVAWKFSKLEDVILMHYSEKDRIQILNYDRRGEWREQEGSFEDLCGACFSAIPESNCIMIYSIDTVRVLHDINKDTTQVKDIEPKESITKAYISPSGRYVLTEHSEEDGLLARVWGFDSEGNSIAKAAIYRPASDSGYFFDLDEAVFSASEQMLRLYCRGRQNLIILWGCDDNGLWTERGVVDNVGKEPVHSHAMLQIMAVDQDKKSEFKIYGYDRNGYWHQKADGCHGTGSVQTGCLSPSGRLLLTCGDDNNVNIWNIDAPEKEV
ncbi:WD40 repeat domain-containing protein [Salinisphaera sp. G21_0]|uniref:WD40 repeat domain-containing protein n=1 Tax=Salinisphaera sp. G21_0 TaxID=2821094 RepID=UPI001ADA9A41|nr:WD40 repeat domain-containing protein [Salinisphaera sp. G21_0]MBO9484054.1 WD40 repeat domain-containing protein [Salinisphaera sp. G21_0]